MIVGVVLFEWDPLWLALSVILETAAIYMVFELDTFFVDRHSRLPFFFAVFQLAFTLLPFGGIMLGSAFLCQWILIGVGSDGRYDPSMMGKYLRDDNLPWLFVGFLLLELITFYIKKSHQSGYQRKFTRFVFKRVILTNLYLIIAIIPLSFFSGNMVVYSIFFIGLRLMLVMIDSGEAAGEATSGFTFLKKIEKWFTTDHGRMGEIHESRDRRRLKNLSNAKRKR